MTASRSISPRSSNSRAMRHASMVLADTDIVGHEEPDGIQLERHEQGDELVGARLDIDVAETAEGAGAGAELQTKRIPQKERRLL